MLGLVSVCNLQYCNKNCMVLSNPLLKYFLLLFDYGTIISNENVEFIIKWKRSNSALFDWWIPTCFRVKLLSRWVGIRSKANEISINQFEVFHPQVWSLNTILSVKKTSNWPILLPYVSSSCFAVIPRYYFKDGDILSFIAGYHWAV